MLVYDVPCLSFVFIFLKVSWMETQRRSKNKEKVETFMTERISPDWKHMKNTEMQDNTDRQGRAAGKDHIRFVANLLTLRTVHRSFSFAQSLHFPMLRVRTSFLGTRNGYRAWTNRLIHVDSEKNRRLVARNLCCPWMLCCRWMLLTARTSYKGNDYIFVYILYI